jgi:hypothetical protein
MPDGCGVKLAYRADERLQSMDHSKGATSMELISLMLYADNMVLLSSCEDELAVMLKVMDKSLLAWVCGRPPARQTSWPLQGMQRGLDLGWAGMEDVEGCQGVEISEGMVEVVT